MSLPSAVRIAEGAVVCDGATITGDVTVGPATVVFPGAILIGPIVIGRGCVVEEGARVVNANPSGSEIMLIGDGNLFEVGCAVQALQVGDYNAFQPKCEVGKGVTVASGCTIGATVRLNATATLENNISVFRLGGQPDEYAMKKRPRNAEANKTKIESYATALASQGKKYYLGKYNQLLPSSTPTET